MNIINIALGVDSQPCSSITLGRRGENEVTQVVVDFSSWVEEFGAGVITLLAMRSQDTSAYPVVLSLDGNTATWDVTSTDTAYKGSGRAEYIYTVGEQIAKSVVFNTVVMQDIGEPSETPPDPYEDWLERLTELGAETQANAEAAQQSAENAEQSAQEAAQEAANAEGYAEQAGESASAAQSAKAASESARDKAQAAQASAEASATAASGSAASASASATAAGASATTASTAAGQAEAAKTAAQAAQSAAEDAAADAQQAAQQAHVEYEQLSGEVDDLSDEVAQQKSALSGNQSGEVISFENTAEAPIEKLLSTFHYRAEGYTGFRLFGYDYNLYGAQRKTGTHLNSAGEEIATAGYSVVGPIPVTPDASHIWVWWENTYSGNRNSKVFAYDASDTPTQLINRNYTSSKNQNQEADLPAGTKYVKVSFSTSSRNVRICTNRFMGSVTLSNPFYGGEIDWIAGTAKNLFNADGSATETTETFEPITADSFSDRTEIYTAIAGANYLPQGTTEATVMLSSASIVKSLQGAVESGLEGLHLSLLGASIESFVGQVPAGNDVYYTAGNAGVYNVDQMWWKILCDKTGMIPLVIDAWSGSSIAYNYATDSTHSDTNKIPMCSDLRTGRLAADGVNPDVILVTGGTNDWTYSKSTTTPLGSWDGRTAVDRSAVVAGQSTFKESLASLIAKLHENYPEAVVVVASLFYTWRGTDLGITRVNDMGYTETDYSNAIEDVCKIMGVPFIDIYNVGFNSSNYYPTYCIDSATEATHPNAAGHEVLANRFIERLPGLVKQFKH